MDKKNKIILIVGLIISLIIIFFSIYPSALWAPPYRSSTPFAFRVQDSQGLASGSLIPDSPLRRGGWNTSQTVPKALSEEGIKVFLTVQDKKYETKINNDSSVFEVMDKIQRDSSPPDIFDFKYEKYTGLGIFITEINEIKGGRGGYWIYYVNGVRANVGVSNYKIKNGDIISWKYEK